MTFNVRYFGHAFHGAGSSRKSIDAICEAIVSLSDIPDAICFQEIETRSIRSRMSQSRTRPKETQFEALMEMFATKLVQHKKRAEYHGVYFPAHAYSVGSVNLFTMGLGILVSNRFKIESHNAIEPCDVTHRRIAALARLKQSRICAHVRLLDSEGLSYDLFNTHLSLPAFASKGFWSRYPGVGFGENQKIEMAQVADYIVRRKASDRFLLVGDFNTPPNTPAYEYLCQKLNVVDPFCGTENSASRASVRNWPTAGFMNLRLRLDHIFMGSGLRCVDLEDCHAFDVKGRWTGLSDHVPLLGRFSAN